MFANKKLLTTMCPGDAYAHQATHTHSQPLFLRLCMILFLSLVGMGSAWADTETIQAGSSTAQAAFSYSGLSTYNYGSNNWVSSSSVIAINTSKNFSFVNENGVTITGITVKGVSDNNGVKTSTVTITDDATTPNSINTGSIEWAARTAVEPTSQALTGVNALKMTAGTVYTVSNSGYNLGIQLEITYTAGATPTLYTVTLDAGENGTCATTYLTQSSEGGSVKLPAVTPNSGYTFSGWYGSQEIGATRIGIANGDYTPTSDITLYAQYSGNNTVENLTQISESFTFEPTYGLQDGMLYQDNKILSLGANSYSSGNGIVIKSNRRIAFKVAAGGTIIVTSNVNGSRTLQLGSKNDATAYGTTTTGKIEYTTNVDETFYLSVAGSDQLYMKKLEVSFPVAKNTVTFNPNGGSGEMANQEVNSGEATALNANTFTKSSYTFVGWNTAADGTGTDYAPGASITLTEDITLYAQWFRFSAQGGQNGNLTKKVGDAGFVYSYIFNGSKNFTRTSDVFEITNTNEDAVGFAYRDGNQVTSGGEKLVRFNVTPKTAGSATITIKYKGDGLYPEATENVTFTVKGTYNVSISNEIQNGTVTTETNLTNPIVEGTNVIFTANANDWYQIDNWYNEAVSPAVKIGDAVNEITVSVSSNLTIKANFIRYYKIATSATNGTVSLKIKDTETNVTADTKIRKGTALVATAAPVAGYHFVKWQLDGVDQAGGMTLDIAKIENFVGATTMTSKTLTAVFEQDAAGTIVGNTDCTSAYNSAHSAITTLEKGKTSHITFVNHSDKAEVWHNWILSVATTQALATASPDLMILRADNWDNLNNGDNRNSATANDFDWDTFKEDMDGAAVAMDVTNSGKHIYVNATITTIGGTTYKYSAINNNDRAEDGTAYFCLTVEKAYLASLNISEPTTAYELSYGIKIEGGDEREDHTECGRVEIENAQGLALRKGTFVPEGEVVKYSAIANTGYAFKNWTSGVTAAIRDITVSGGAISEGLVIPRAVFAKEYVSTTWTFEEGNDDGTYTENGMDLVAFGVSWQVSGLKLDSNDAYFTFTPNAAGILTVKGTVFKNSSSLLVVTQNSNTLSCSETSGTEATYTVSAGQTVTIKRTGSEIRISEIVFTPTEDAQLTAPLISVENGIVTFTNPNEGTTLYFKYDRTKAGDISDSNFDGSSTLTTKQITLPYGAYPADWIQAQVGSGALASPITKYPEGVIVAPPVPVMTKTATAINFTVPTGCFVEFHVGSESAEAIAVYSTTATVDLISATQMTIKGAGSPAADRTVDLATIYVKTVAEYDIPNSEKNYIGSDLISVTPEATNVISATIPATLEIYVGQNMKINPTVVTKDGKSTGDLHKSWVLVSGSDYLTLSETNRTTSSITGKKSNTSDNATAVVKAVFDGVESNECTVTIKRTTLAVRADHVALSHNGNEARTVRAIAYNPYTRATVGISGTKAEDDKNLTITTAPKSGSSAFATSSNNTITPIANSEIGSETWVVTVAPKTDADKACYKTGTAEIEVTCRNYLYAYSTSVPATSPTARPVENAAHDVALNYYAGHNPADCKSAEGDEPLKTWGDKNRGPQEQVIANYSKTIKDGKEIIQRPYARIHGWDGIKNVAEPTMNSLSEQHTRNASPVYNGNSNGTFTYKQYSYTGDHDEFNVPVMGSFYRFYPEKNGTLIAYLCVNGQFSDSEMEKLAKDNSTQTGYASRNTYFLDPYANSMDIKNATVQPTSTIQSGFFYYTLDNCKNTANLTKDVEALLNNWAKWGNDEKNANGELVIPVKSSSYDEGKASYTISDVDWDLFKKLAQDKVGVFQQPIANGDGSFRVITKTYVRCEVPVEKGRVYYVSPTGTKTRMAGVEFIPAGDDPVAVNVDYYNGTMQEPKGDTAPYVVAIDQNTWMVPSNNGKYYNVTLKDRSFKAGQWYSFCMPFDVPQKQIHDIFGADAVTIHFDNVSIDGDNIKMNFWSHFYDQTRAGRPIMIKMPATFPGGGTELSAGSVTFQHVKLNVVEPSKLFITDGEWTFKGSYTPVTMDKNAVIINNQTFYHYKNTAKTLAGNRAWIQGPSDQSAAKYNLVTTFSMFNEDEGDTITGIEEVLSEMGLNMMKSNDNIYNVNGQVVGQGSDINTLPKGVYIVNGKKQIVK